ncbi:hypothetical protein VNO77_39528 [Canavalia gladiata]|uniref:Uncharacterized protein n=1 Tax=Canavalia gladiata TaxID=3824 RepID=A0AAN9PXU1_CANGL
MSHVFEVILVHAQMMQYISPSLLWMVMDSLNALDFHRTCPVRPLMQIFFSLCVTLEERSYQEEWECEVCREPFISVKLLFHCFHGVFIKRICNNAYIYISANSHHKDVKLDVVLLSSESAVEYGGLASKDANELDMKVMIEEVVAASIIEGVALFSKFGRLNELGRRVSEHIMKIIIGFDTHDPYSSPFHLA